MPRISIRPGHGMIVLTGLLLASLLLVACGGASQPESQVPVGSNEVAADEQGEASETEAGDNDDGAVEATEEAEAASSAPTEPAADQPSTSPPSATCSTVDIPGNTLIAALSDQDWSKGSPEAPITVIEYGDFQ